MSMSAQQQSVHWATSLLTPHTTTTTTTTTPHSQRSRTYLLKQLQHIVPRICLAGSPAAAAAAAAAATFTLVLATRLFAFLSPAIDHVCNSLQRSQTPAVHPPVLVNGSVAVLGGPLCAHGGGIRMCIVSRRRGQRLHITHGRGERLHLCSRNNEAASLGRPGVRADRCVGGGRRGTTGRPRIPPPGGTPHQCHWRPRSNRGSRRGVAVFGTGICTRRTRWP